MRLIRRALPLGGAAVAVVALMIAGTALRDAAVSAGALPSGLVAMDVRPRPGAPLSIADVARLGDVPGVRSAVPALSLNGRLVLESDPPRTGGGGSVLGVTVPPDLFPVRFGSSPQQDDEIVLTNAGLASLGLKLDDAFGRRVSVVVRRGPTREEVRRVSGRIVGVIGDDLRGYIAVIRYVPASDAASWMALAPSDPVGTRAWVFTTDPDALADAARSLGLVAARRDLPVGPGLR